MRGSAAAVAGLWLTMAAGAAAVPEQRIQRIYALGDSISDTGNLFQLTNQTVPDPSLYFSGRFSNGPVWVEYLSRRLRAQLRSYAYGKATTDNAIFPADARLTIPGCLQQADQFLIDYNKQLRIIPKTPENTLLTLAFFGNDFFNQTATPLRHVRNVERCVKRILNKSDVRQIVLVTSTAPELYPMFNSVPRAFRDLKIQQEAQVRKLWQTRLPRLRAKYPQVTFHEFNYRGLLFGLKDGTSPLLNHRKLITTSGCLPSFEIDAIPPGTVKCRNPDRHMFFDGLHPTTPVHRAMADTVLAQIESRSPPPSPSYARSRRPSRRTTAP